MWLIPGKTKIRMEIFKGVTVADAVIGAITLALEICLWVANFGSGLRIVLALLLLFIAALLIVRIDSEPNYIFVLHIIRHLGYPRHFDKTRSNKYLINKHRVGEKKATIDDFLEDEDPELFPEITYREKKKADKKEWKSDNKLLKSKDLTKEEEDEIWLKRARQSAERKQLRKQERENNTTWHDMEDIIGFTDIRDGYVVYGRDYYGQVIEISPVEFRFFSEHRRNSSIVNGIGKVLRTVNPDYAANIVKIDRPLHYEEYLLKEHEKVDSLRESFEKAVITEDEFKARVEVVFDRIKEIESLIHDNRVIIPHYYLVLYDSDKNQLRNTVDSAVMDLTTAEIPVRVLDDKELAIFLKYSNGITVNEEEIDEIDPEDYASWALPEELNIKVRTCEVNKILTHNMRVIKFPMLVGDAWLAGQMSIPSCKVVIKCKPMDRQKSIKNIDRSLNELRVQYASTSTESRLIELQNHIDSLSSLLVTLQNDSEALLSVNVYITAYDKIASEISRPAYDYSKVDLVRVTNMKRTVKRYYSEDGFRLTGHDFEQIHAFIGSQINGYDPYLKEGRGMPSNTISAAYPWIFANVSDEGGVKLGSSDNVPVFIDFFKRNSERVNSNMVIIGKSGSGKSYATKSLLTNLAADDSKIFILDPENEYTELAANLHGKFINVGNATQGRLNPFHIMTALDDEEAEEGTVSGSYATHLQFLEEFFKQIIPDADKDAMEYLNSIVDRMYGNMGITAETDLSKLGPLDYPIFDDLYDAVLREFQQTENEYIRTMLRNLMNYVSKFSTGGRNANIWNGPSTVTTEENFSVFNFQSLLANRNGLIANAQMLLVLKYIDNEIIKNRDYNTKNHTNRKIIIVIDEAHVFIDEKYPIALDFMFQLAKRIRKYNGMQIVITQNIKDFVGSEELQRKSTAIINACQYSFIFALSPNDMDDLCKLYDKAGGINSSEQEQIVNAPRGQAFVVMSPQSRTTFGVEVPQNVVRMFQEPNFESRYFAGEEGALTWEGFLEDSRELHNESAALKKEEEPVVKEESTTKHSFVRFEEITEDEAKALSDEIETPSFEKKEKVHFEEITEEDLVTEPEKTVTKVEDTVVPEKNTIKYEKTADAQVEVNKALIGLMEKFSYDAMSAEIRNIVAMELKKSVEESQSIIEDAKKEAEKIRNEALKEKEAMEVSARATEKAQETEKDTDFLASIFGAVSENVTAESKAEVNKPKPVEEEEPKGFDFFEALFEESKNYVSTSKIEKMELYGEEVLDITVEDLFHYVSGLSKKSGTR